MDETELQTIVKNYYKEEERYDWVNDTRYPEKLFHRLRCDTVARIVNKFISNQDQQVIDVGCGTGLVTRKIKSNNITALDINPWAIERAKININKACITFINGDAESLPLEAEKFDVCLCTEMLEHLVRPDLAINEIRRVLKPDAFFIGSVPSRSFVWKYRKIITSTSPVQEPFHNNYNIREINSLLCDFRIVEIKQRIFGLTIIFVAQK